MTARTLDLREGCLQAPTAYDVAIVGSMMLFPADEELRRQSLEAVAFWIGYLAGTYPQPETSAERKEFAELIRMVPRVADYEGPVKEGYRCGMIAGGLLYEMVVAAELRRSEVTLTAIKKRIARNFARDHISISTINNKIWRRYRCVAAYWAAYAAGGGDDIPCRPGDLGTFLAMADEFRRRAEATHTPPKSPKTLLRFGETVMIPPSIELPQGRLRFAAVGMSSKIGSLILE